jgi:hypothetical protein
MHAAPLNRDTPFQPWPRLDPGWIDFNPCCVQLPSGRWLGVIRRDAVPPEPGKGSLWTLPLTDDLQPAGPPTLLLARGEDPRAVRVGERVFVFHAIIERDAAGRVSGSAVRFLECAVDGAPGDETLRPLQMIELPKNPLNKPRTGDPGEAWEKNWVPFVHRDDEIGLIYSHAPWEVLMMAAGGEDMRRRYTAAHRGTALHWAWGEIRGGTTPVRWQPAPDAEPQWLTFFHSSAVVASRKLYFVGACSFDTAPPFAPRLMTREPLLVAPYRTGAHQHGWRFAGSVVFPLGCQPTDRGFRLLCGLDDGLVAPFEVDTAALRERLLPLDQALPAGPQPRNTDDQVLARNGEPLALGPFDDKALHLARLLDLLHPGGGLLVDAAPGDGMPLLRLAPRFERNWAWAEGADARRLQRLLALNDALDRVSLSAPPPALALDSLPAEQTRGLALLRVDDADAVAVVLAGARQTLGRERPLVLLQLPGGDDGARVQQMLTEAQYSCEALFPFTPTRRLAFPVERRAEFGWLV